MNGNIGRSTYSGGTATPFQTQQNSHIGTDRFIFAGPEGGAGRQYFSGRRMPCSSRSFHSGRNSYGRYRHHHEPTMPPQMAPTQTATSRGQCSQGPAQGNSYHVNPQGFINGIKKIVNNFINPKLNCDFYSDHHRFYNPKYRNNFMMNRRDNKSRMDSDRADATDQTTLLDLQNPRVSNCDDPVITENAQPKKEDLQRPAHCAAFQFTIFTSDDFPALPEVKKQITVLAPTVTKLANKLPRRRRKCRETKAESIEKSTVPATKTTCEDFVVLAKPKIVDGASTSDGSTATTSYPWRAHPRLRQMSECSDDSFVICFSDEAPEGVLEVTHHSDDSDESDDETSGSSSDDESIDETDNHLKVPDIEQLDSGFDERKDKKVRFNLKPEVHVMYKWDYAYRAARKGEWEKYARDRDRFKKRIDRTAYFLNPILLTEHRENIYRRRFCDSDKSATLQESRSAQQ